MGLNKISSQGARFHVWGARHGTVQTGARHLLMRRFPLVTHNKLPAGPPTSIAVAGAWAGASSAAPAASSRQPCLPCTANHPQHAQLISLPIISPVSLLPGQLSCMSSSSRSLPASLLQLGSARLLRSGLPEASKGLSPLKIGMTRAGAAGRVVGGRCRWRPCHSLAQRLAGGIQRLVAFENGDDSGRGCSAGGGRRAQRWHARCEALARDSLITPAESASRSSRPCGYVSYCATAHTTMLPLLSRRPSLHQIKPNLNASSAHLPAAPAGPAGTLDAAPPTRRAAGRRPWASPAQRASRRHRCRPTAPGPACISKPKQGR